MCFRGAFISVLLVSCMLEINLISSICEGIYKCSIRHDCSGLFFICMTCTYGEMFPAHDSFVLF